MPCFADGNVKWVDAGAKPGVEDMAAEMVLIVIAKEKNFKVLAKRREPACSRALRQVRGVVQR